MFGYSLGIRSWVEDRLGVARWYLKGRPLPMPRLVKEWRLLREMSAGPFAAFIESGTYLGETVRLAQGRFKKIYSIEVEPTLFKNAQETFSADPSVEILQGDSGLLLPDLLKRPALASSPVIFWLDGHYSAGNTGKGELDTPILKELEPILARSCGDRVLIDDAHSFGHDKDYPTLEELRRWLDARRPGLELKIADNIIALTLPGA